MTSQIKANTAIKAARKPTLPQLYLLTNDDELELLLWLRVFLACEESDEIRIGV